MSIAGQYAGTLVNDALRSGIEFQCVCVYGIGCVYEAGKAFLIHLELDFKQQVAEFCSYEEAQDIDEVICYALKRCGICNF